MRQDRSNNPQAAFTLTEVVIATVLFVIAITGLFATIASTRVPVTDSAAIYHAELDIQRVVDRIWYIIGPGILATPVDPRVTPNIVHNINELGLNPPVAGTYTVTIVGGLPQVAVNVQYVTPN